MRINDFGSLSDGRKAGLYILKNSNGMTVSVTDYGATLVSIKLLDKDGNVRDVVLGHDDVAGYEKGDGFIGASVGRFANRIGNASFSLNGETYELTANDGTNSLHGGRDPYSFRLWQAVIPFGKISSGSVAAKVNATESMNDGQPAYVQMDQNGDTVTFALDSPDGDQGYPGNLHVEVTYTLTNNNELHIDYRAKSDKDTALNLTNHSYFNLSGHDSGSVLEQVCEIEASKFTPNDAGLLPTGELRDVEGTPMDFRSPKAFGRDINDDYEQLKLAGGYDHNFIIDGWDEVPGENEKGFCNYRKAAVLRSEESGISMTVMTDLPGMQLYTACALGRDLGKDGAVYGKYNGVCFETQFWPDAVNKEHFPGGVIKAGEEYYSRTSFCFE